MRNCFEKLLEISKEITIGIATDNLDKNTIISCIIGTGHNMCFINLIF